MFDICFYVAGNPATSSIRFTHDHHHNNNHQSCRQVPCTWQKKTFVASIRITIQMYSDDMNLFNKHNNLPYSDLGRIHKDTGNRPLKLGQFFSLGDFS